MKLGAQKMYKLCPGFIGKKSTCKVGGSGY